MYIQKDISKNPLSHSNEASGAPCPIWKIRRKYQLCVWFNFFTVALVISVHVPAPFRRLGMQHASHNNSAVSIPPAAFDLQSFTIWLISRQAPLILPPLASTVAATDSDRPPSDRNWPSHFSDYFLSGSKSPHNNGSLSSSVELSCLSLHWCLVGHQYVPTTKYFLQ